MKTLIFIVVIVVLFLKRKAVIAFVTDSYTEARRIVDEANKDIDKEK